MSKIVILGAGPAGLAAGYELVKNGHQVTIVERENKVGGLARTEKYQTNSFDIGPHRFFTKNQEIQKFWEEILGQDLLRRPRLTRIYYRKKYFYYPLRLFNALKNLGFIESLEIFLSLITTRLSKIFKRQPDQNFEDWVVHRFGRRLFNHFFKSYTEKLWGISTSEIGVEWASQRLQSMSLLKVISSLIFKPKSGSVKSWVEEFYYPRLGAGQLHEQTARFIEQHGGQILLAADIRKVTANHHNQVIGVTCKNSAGNVFELSGDYFISTLPISALMRVWSPTLPTELITAVNSLKFRSTILVNLLIDKDKSFPDNWLYIHEPDVQILRISNPMSFSPDLSPANQNILALEYVCDEQESLWSKSTAELLTLGREELIKIGLARSEDILGGTVIKAPNTYPVYTKDYQQHTAQIFSFLGAFKNFQTIGRAGLFRYNNMDHSMLTGFYAARNIMGGHYNIFNVNTDEEYHEIQK